MAPPSYAMFWWFDDGPRWAGRIEVAGDHLDLAATSPSGEIDRIGFDEVSRVALDRGVLRLERADAATVSIGSLDTPGALRELADRVVAASRSASF